MPVIQDIASRLPEGVTLEDVRVVECPAAVFETLDLLPETHPVVRSGLFQAGPPLVNDQNKPTIMKIAAWMAHEGVNRNRQMFIKEDLQELAPTLFREPNFGVMDFNHSAFRPFSDEPKVIGIWHSAEFLWDKQAQKWGLLASGVMFSWLFPDHADTLLADQERLGHMRFSMACIPGSVEVSKDAAGPFEILHKPVFMTVSALDVAPADPAAEGRGSEATDDSVDNLRQRLLAIAAEHPWQLSEQALTAATKGERMADSQELVELVEARTKLEAEVEKLTEQLTAAQQELETTKTDHASVLTASNVKITELEAVAETLRTQVAELTTTIETLTAERDELLTFKQETEAAEAEAEKEATLAERLESLPKQFIEALSKKSEERQAALKAKIAAMTDDEFTMYKEDELGFAATEPSMFDRSRREGLLTTTDDESDLDFGDRVRKLLAR